MLRHKLLGAIVAVGATLAFTGTGLAASQSLTSAGSAQSGVSSLTTGQITYTGQGMGVKGPNLQKCNPPDAGGTGVVLQPYQPYLLWVLNGSVTGSATLHIAGTGGGDYVMAKVGSTWKVVTPLFTRAQLVGPPAAYATYASGTPNNLVVSHGCNGPVQVASHISTTIHLGGATEGGALPAHVTLGALVHDSAVVTVDNGATIPANSTVTFTFSNGDQQTDPVASDGTVDLALPEGPLAAGSYSYSAAFNSGNTDLVANSASDPEPLTIEKAQLSISTAIHHVVDGVDGPLSSDLPLGSTVHDTATVTGGVASFDLPAVSFKLDGVDIGLAANEAPAVFASEESAPQHAGDHSYQAVVETNANYDGDTSAVEPFHVNQAQLGITTAIHDPGHNVITTIPSGSLVHDTAQVSGALDLPGFGVPASAVHFTLNGDLADQLGGTNEIRTVDKQVFAGFTYVYAATVDSSDDYIGARSVDEPLAVTVQLGMTQGFWGNSQGQAFILGHGGYDANGGVNVGRAVITTQDLANTILTGSGAYPTIFNDGLGINSGLAGHVNTLNTTASQTLALGYNLEFVTIDNGYAGDYAGQTLGALGATIPVGSGLTASGTVQDAYTYAVGLINGSVATGSTTQGQLGALNTMLGQINREV